MMRRRLAAARAIRREDGASAVEFALVAPLLILLLFGVINFGFLFSEQLSLNNSVRQGARAAVVAGSGTTCAGVVTSVRSGAFAAGQNTANIDVTTLRSDGSNPCGTTANSTSTTKPCTGSFDTATSQSDSIEVTATFNAKMLLPMPIPGFKNAFKLTAKGVYQCEFT
jgi:Flp pilus assembly protein TadG